MFKRISIVVLVVTVLALVVTGAVLAQEPTPPTDDAPFFRRPGTGEGFGMGRMGGRPGCGGRSAQALADALGVDVEEVEGAVAGTIAELAEAQGMTLEELVDALAAPMIERIQQAVDDGNITQEEADERIAKMEESLLEALESGSWFGSGTGMGRGGFGGRRGGAQLDTLAEALDMTVEELQEALTDGQTVAEVAEAQGVSLEDIVDVLMAPMIERIQQAVDDGDITQEQADERIEQMEERILHMLESGPGQMPGGFRGRPGGMIGGFRGGNGNTFGFSRQTAPSVDL
jgi:nucleoid DNA-binding protein